MSITRAAVVFVGLLSAFGCEGTVGVEGAEGQSWVDPSGVGDGTGTATPQMVSDGAELYALYCESCHGPEGTGAASWPGSIQGYEPIHGLVVDGRGTMPPISLDDGQVALVQAYLLSFGAADWSTLTGRELYDTACASCHGAEAEGSDRGPQLRFRDDPYFDFVTKNGGWSTSRWDSPMEAYSDRITDAQLDEMTTWINAFENATTGEGLYVQFCANCHGGGGVRGRFEEEWGESIAGVSRDGKEDAASNRSYMPGWSTSEITDSEMQMMQTYVNAQ